VDSTGHLFQSFALPPGVDKLEFGAYFSTGSHSKLDYIYLLACGGDVILLYWPNPHREAVSIDPSFPRGFFILNDFYFHDNLIQFVRMWWIPGGISRIVKNCIL
jgi:hypothetical protein